MCESAYIQTFTGGKFHILDPTPDEVHIEDIAHHLATINRFCGACIKPLSVAQHSVLVSRKCPANRLWGLLHDASEAYIHDISRPLKYSGRFGGYFELEISIMAAVCDKFGMKHAEWPFKIPEEVRVADERMCLTERRCLMTPTDHDWSATIDTETQPYAEKIIPWYWADAETEFLEEFNKITGGYYG